MAVIKNEMSVLHHNLEMIGLNYNLMMYNVSHLKLWIAIEKRNFKWVKIEIK